MANRRSKIKEYYNDRIIIDRIANGEKYVILITEVFSTEVVLGRSMLLDEDVYENNCIKDNISIYRRMGGGGTVVLSKGTLVISVGGISSISFHFREQMNAINSTIIKSLKHFGVENVNINGISDITIGNKKILGSSFYNKQNTILYQGSLLYNPDFNLFERYLKQPKKTPDYRQNRNHRDFLTSITKEGYKIDLKQLIKIIEQIFLDDPPWEKIIV